MNFDKLLDFLSAKDKGFLISSVVLFPLAYMISLMYGEGKFLSFDLIDRLFIVTGIIIIFQFLIFAILVYKNDGVPKNGIISNCVATGCFISIFLIIARFIVWPNGRWWFPIAFTFLFLVGRGIKVVSKKKSGHGN